MGESVEDTSSEMGSYREKSRVLEESPIVYDKIYVAVGKDIKENKGIVTWAMQNSGGKEICLVHVLAPDPAGGKPPKSLWGKQELVPDDEKDRKEANKALESYIEHCGMAGNRAQALCVEAESVEKGIITLISHRRIGKLVMGAAAESKYKRNMKDLKSEKAMFVFQKAPAFCTIWFVCKGTLAHTRTGVEPESSLSRSPSAPIVSVISRSPSTRMSIESSDDTDHHPFPTTALVQGLSPSPSVHSVRSESEIPPFLLNRSFPSTSSSSGASLRLTQSPSKSANNELSNQLHNAMAKADDLKKDIHEALVKGGALENLYHEERVRRKELEEELSKKNGELQAVSNQKSYLQEELEAYKKERDNLLRQLADAVSEAGRLRSQNAQMKPSVTQGSSSKFHADFSVSEIAHATCNFNETMKIGEGGYGNTYKGILRHVEVAIKVPKQGSSQGTGEFTQEVEVLSRLRHPNIVTLIGVCSEAKALIYEYAHNGTLEDRLFRKNNTPALSWKTRIRIARDLCCVLIFLQSSTPESLIHGDLKPSNILLDASMSCKLSDFGICRGVQAMADNTTMMYVTGPKGTLAYMDPLFMSTGVLTPKSDIYSFGIILLQMLTGKPGIHIMNEVQPAFDKGRLSTVLDMSAGEWPVELAWRMAALALGCCELNRKDRPDIGVVWKALNQ